MWLPAVWCDFPPSCIYIGWCDLSPVLVALSLDTVMGLCQNDPYFPVSQTSKYHPLTTWNFAIWDESHSSSCEFDIPAWQTAEGFSVSCVFCGFFASFFRSFVSTLLPADSSNRVQVPFFPVICTNVMVYWWLYLHEYHTYDFWTRPFSFVVVVQLWG